jgi:hypothetical protein
MVKEFRDFARIIEEKDYERAEYYANETLDVMRILEVFSGADRS